VSEALLWTIAIVGGVIGAAVVAIYLFRPPE
jgi:uncharacterized membrane protein YsdA (DUF1294 family)